MDSVTLDLDPREITGKKVKQLRKAGIVPGVIHDHGKESIHVQAEYQTLYKVYSTAGRHHPVELKANGKKYTALIKSVSLDPKYNSLTHIVFNAVKANEKVEAEIPIRPKYGEGNDSTPAERASLIVLTNLESVQVKALPKDLPEYLEYDAEKLVEVGDHVTVADLNIPDGVEIETEPEHAVATVYEPSALQAANDAAGGDAEAEAAEDVESEHESGTEEGTQKDEIRPGGKEEKEDKTQGHGEQSK
ncbi:MAG TPA: 50S ribosomal protein L25 [Candidatus Saccharimonadales bacterium]|nr:50S ribosomal protein L25 [Candidatus Saccharimonadales bacterium]